MQTYAITLKYETTILVESKDKEEAEDEAFQELFRDDTIYDPDAWEIEIKPSDNLTVPTVVRE